jgi:hypothetical protein
VAEEKASKRFRTWLAGVLAAVIGGLVLFAIENYQRPGVAMYLDSSTNHLSSITATVINKSNLPLHKCSFIVFVSYSMGLGESAHKLSDDFELGPHESKAWNISSSELGLDGTEHSERAIGMGNCLYFNVFGIPQSVDFDVW